MRWGRCCLSCSRRPPFVEDTPAQLMFRHVNTEAPAAVGFGNDSAATARRAVGADAGEGTGDATRYDGSAVAVDAALCLELAGRGPLACRQGVVVPASMGMSDRMGGIAGRRAARTSGRRAACCGSIRAALDDTSARGIGVCVFGTAWSRSSRWGCAILFHRLSRGTLGLPALPKSADVPPAPSRCGTAIRLRLHQRCHSWRRRLCRKLHRQNRVSHRAGCGRCRVTR